MNWKPLVLGFLGMVLGAIILHLFQDHLLVDAIRADIASRSVKSAASPQKGE